jgi:RNA methyltransferase, TrmH family
MITSPQNAKLKLARSLVGRPKERLEEHAFLVEGVRLVEEALEADWPLRFVLYTDGINERGLALIKRLAAKNIEVEQVTQILLNSISGTENPQGILAVADLVPLSLPKRLDFILIADQIRDPGNLGTLLRTATAAGVQAVLLPPETTDAFAPKVVRAGMGAHFRLPILSASWAEIRALVAGLQVYLAEMESSLSCWEADFRSPVALIIGGEAKGASSSARTLATQQVFIPMIGTSESLNAGIAGSILLFEVVRQRTDHGGGLEFLK